MKHYHVLQGLSGGYMPNTNEACRMLTQAREVAKWWAGVRREEGDKVYGSARIGWYDVGEHEHILITSPCYDDCDIDNPGGC